MDHVVSDVRSRLRDAVDSTNRNFGSMLALLVVAY